MYKKFLIYFILKKLIKKMEKESIIMLGEEKYVFERAIIEAFKQKSSKAIYEKLNIALDEIKFIVADIKKNNDSINRKINQNFVSQNSIYLKLIFHFKLFNNKFLILNIFIFSCYLR